MKKGKGETEEAAAAGKEAGKEAGKDAGKEKKK
jgi:hypothetical protein